MDCEPSNLVANVSARRQRLALAALTRHPAAAPVTRKTFKKLKTWLAQSADRVRQVRHNLGARWEADPALREAVATDRLAKLSGYLGQIEDGVAGAIVVAAEFL